MIKVKSQGIKLPNMIQKRKKLRSIKFNSTRVNLESRVLSKKSTGEKKSRRHNFRNNVNVILLLKQFLLFILFYSLGIIPNVCFED